MEPQHMIVELFLKGPFLVHHIGTKWVFSTFSLLASPPFPPGSSDRMQITTFNNFRAIPDNIIFQHLVILIPILSEKTMLPCNLL